MKAYEIQGEFGLDNLVQAERDEPVCQPGQVRVAVSATSLNYRDLMVVKGLYNPRQPLPLTPLSDGVGRVVEVGEGVTRVEVGDRVAGIFVQGWIAGKMTRAMSATTLGGPLSGMLAESVCLPESGVVRLPEYLSDIEAATLPCAALTAWNTMFEEGDLQPGQTVLLQGTGGVSIFALQLAVAAGAEVIITSSSDEKLARARELGAHHTINYRDDPQWGRTARKLTGGEGVDLVVEVGGAETLDQSLKAVRVGGTIGLIGILSGTQKAIQLTSILMRNIRLQGVLVGSRAGFEAMNRAMAVHEIRPVVDRVFPFDEARAALDYLASGKHFGKVCIQL